MSTNITKTAAVLLLGLIVYYHVEAILPFQLHGNAGGMMMEGHSPEQGCCGGHEEGHDPATCVCSRGHSSNNPAFVLRLSSCSPWTDTAFPVVFKIQIYCPLSDGMNLNELQETREVIYNKNSLKRVFWGPQVYRPPKV